MSAASETPPPAGTGPGAAWPFAAGQAAIAAWIVAASRVATGIAPNAAGVLDDASLVALFTALQLALRGFAVGRGPVARLATGLPLLLLLALHAFANALFFEFFQTPLSIASLQLAGIAADASSSLPPLVGPGNVLSLLVAPIGAQLVALARPARGARPWRAGAAAFAVALALAAAAAATRQPVHLFAEQSPAMSLLRDALARAARGAFGVGPPAARIQDLPRLLNRAGFTGYRFAGTEASPLRQVPDPPLAPETPRNVVLILMESMRGLEMQRAFREVPVTPALNAIEEDAVVFPNFYANGMTTVDAEFSILCSALPVVNESPVYIRKPHLPIRCLPEILRDVGYSTHWISAYKSTYANKRMFLRRHGVQGVHDRETLDPAQQEHPDVGWGMGDVDMFAQALDVIRGLPQPFFVEIMTLSNHHPFDHDYDLAFPDALARVPGKRHYRNYLRGMYYTDHAVGGFLDAARREPWFDGTLFVILGDHGVHSFPTAPGGGALGPVLESEAYFRDRLILYAPRWLEPASHDTLGSQIDVAPTLLDLLGIRSENSFLGVSLFADVPDDRRFALMNIGHVFNMRVGDQYCYSVGYSCFEGVFPRCKKGVEPMSLGHTCFEPTGDLFAHPDLPGERGSDVETVTLDALARLAILDRAERIMELNRRLIDEERFRASR